MKVVVVGTGYVGLVAGACFAEGGVQVTCVDVDEGKIEGLKNGVIPIHEPGLQDLVVRNQANNRLQFSTRLADELPGVDVVFIAVGTPPDEDGSADLRHVLAVAREIGQHIDQYVLVVTKSTVPIGTAVRVREAIQQELLTRAAEVEFDVASNPEFLKEGSAILDFLKPDRVIVGVDSERARATMERLYKPFVLNGNPILFMDIPSVEMTKYAANAMLATKISFMNDIANLCERVGANVDCVRQGIGSDNRIGRQFIYPGIGYGGSCFPKDVRALIKTAQDHSYDMRILDAVEAVNHTQKSVLFNKLVTRFGTEQLADMTVAIWGLAFKPGTDDVREAPALTIIESLLNCGSKVVAYDPVARDSARQQLGDRVQYAYDPYYALDNADCLLVVTEWKEFRSPNVELMKKRMRGHVIFDGRNALDAEEFAANGFEYDGIGMAHGSLAGSKPTLLS